MGLDQQFMSLLTMRMSWQPVLGSDLFGNEDFGTQVDDIPCFVTSKVTDFGGEDGHNKSEGRTVTRVEVLTDAIGIAPGDRLVVPGPLTVYVTSVDTPEDEQGNNLMHTITAETPEKG